MTKMAHFFEFPRALYTEHNQFMDVIQEALTIQTHADLFHWLQGDLQTYLPHQILLAAWTIPGSNTLEVDIISALQGMRTSNVVSANMMPFLQNLLARWKQGGYQLFWLRNEGSFAMDLSKVDSPCSVSASFKRMRSAVVHGIKDERERDQVLYIVFNQTPCSPRLALYYFKLLLPHIDTALRQLTPLRSQPNLCSAVRPYVEFGLSQREREIMNWVRAGKTNEVIGVILDISPFTVKNHLKRIFRKLDVSNRAQAVSKIHEHSDAGRPG
jgi:transcriptional regulator EpsA